MHVAPGNRDLLPFWVFFGLKTSPAVAGRVSKMAITWFRGPKTSGTFDQRMRTFKSSVIFVPKVAENARRPGKSRFIAILGVFRLKNLPGRGLPGD